jgi:hypothetical protein
MVVGAALLAAVRAETPTAPPPKGRGMWFWAKAGHEFGAVSVVGRKEREADALECFRRWNVKRLYGSYSQIIEASPAKVAHWNRQLHEADIRSEFLFGENDWLFEPSKLLAAATERVVKFNRSRKHAAERFDGIALDIEPHATKQWKSGTPADKRIVLERFVLLCLALRVHLDNQGAQNLPVSVAVAFSHYRLSNEGGAVGWHSKEDRDDWFARFASVAPTVSVMAYERATPEGIDRMSAWLRENYPGRVIVALRARLGHEWKTLADLQRVLPAVEAMQMTGIDIENYHLLREAEGSSALAR